ncbi:MAG: NADH-quinone oxidoreductase subunit NuoH [Gemmataceae bacterium]
MPQFSFWFTVLLIAVVVFVILNTVAFMILVERKVSAYMQDRLGPNRVGPYGLLQPIVDGAKMLLKEDIIPTHVDKIFFLLAPCIAAGTALLAFAIVPFGPTSAPPPPAAGAAAFDSAQAEYQSHHQFVVAPGIDIGILFTFSVSSLAVYGIILGGWSSNNKYSILGSLRSSAQIISYEIPLGMSILGLVLYSGSLNLETTIDWQARHGWNILYHPLAFFLFLTSVFAECNRLPFDLPEAEQELVGGYHTEYSSIKFGMFYLGEYTHMITTSFLVSVLFLGGWEFFGLTDGHEWYHTILKFVSILGKAAFFLVFYVVVRWTLPRFRFDQLMGIAWKVLIPLSIVNLLSVMVVRELDLPLIVLPVISVVLFAAAAAVSARRPGPMGVTKTGNIHAPAALAGRY